MNAIDSIKKVLIAYDGSSCAKTAIGDLKRAGLPTDVDATVVCASDVPPDVYSFGFAASELGGVGAIPLAAPSLLELTEREAERTRAIAVEGARLVSDFFPVWTVHTDAPAGPPYWAVVEKARHWRADLIVVGSHGRTALGGLLLGSVSQNVLSHAPCSVRIGRTSDAHDRPESPSRVLLAIDGSLDSALAVEAVCSRRWPRGTEARVVTVLDTSLVLALHSASPWPAAAGEDVLPPSWRAVEAVADRLRPSGLDVSSAVLEGDPKHVLVREADRFGADCVFLGARGHSRLQRFFLGSVSAAVAARAACAVEVIRAWSEPAA